TATAGSDYITSSGTLTIAANATSGTFTVPIIGDTDVEANESFVVNLSNPVNASLANTQATGTITNDDSGGGAIKINFQLNGSPLVSGYQQDNGDVFA